MKRIFTILFTFFIIIETGLIFITLFIDFKSVEETEERFFLNEEDSLVNNMIAGMSLDEKIGQLFFLELDNAQSASKELIDSVNNQYYFSGIKFKNTEVLNQLIITNYLQSKSKFPLLIGSEGSIINRGDFNLPIGPIINAVEDSSFADFYLEQFVEVLKFEGVNIDFSNSITILDSIKDAYGFSEDAGTVIKQSVFFRKKLHKQKIISCLKFSDSLLFIKDSIAVDSLTKQNQPFGISKFFAIQLDQNIIEKTEKNEIAIRVSDFNTKYYGFKGLVFSPLKDTTSAEEFKYLLNSGTDVFILTNNVEKNIQNFKSLVSNNQLSINEIDRRVKRILIAKKWTEADKPGFQSAEISLTKILNDQRVLVSWKLYEKSFSLLKNRNNILPISNLLNSRTHLLTFIDDNMDELEENLNYYMDFTSSKYTKGKLRNASVNYAQNLIVAIGSKGASILKDTALIQELKDLDRSKNLIVICYGKPQSIENFLFADVVIYAYDMHPFSQAVTAQTLVGAIQPAGRIVPALTSFNKTYYAHIPRLKYTIPEAAGFDSHELKNVDTLIDWAINAGAMPGCEILAAKDGKVFFYKAYGYHTYSKLQKVKALDIYDLASISKVAATTLVAMKLVELDSIRMEDSIKDYVKNIPNCTIKNCRLSDFFVHKTGLPADMPILQYISYRDSVTKRFDKYYSEVRDSVHTVKVADNYYLRKDYLDSVVLGLYTLEIDTTKPYLYSDINFNIIYDVLIRKIPGSYTKFLFANFYTPLQLRTMGYLPLDRFNEKRIAPTQDDKYWRKQLLRGTPHDETAALYGGISGNAGLFSNANDLAILFQMLINGGYYGGRKVLEKETVEKFVSSQENSPRGLGFNRKKGGLFGHSGFTGCVVWANPENGFIFVFLSNSIHPKATNKKLSRLKIRSKVYDLIWKAYKPGDLKMTIAKK